MTTFKSASTSVYVVTCNSHNSICNDVTYRLLIVSVSSYYILHIHIVTETRCVIIISIKLTFSLQYFYSLIKTTNSKNIHPYPCQNSISDYCLFRGFFFFSPPVYLAITAIYVWNHNKSFHPSFQK